MFLDYLNDRVKTHEREISQAQNKLKQQGTAEEIKRKARYDILHHSTQMAEDLIIRGEFVSHNRAQK